MVELQHRYPELAAEEDQRFAPYAALRYVGPGSGASSLFIAAIAPSLSNFVAARPPRTVVVPPPKVVARAVAGRELPQDQRHRQQ
jgi:hypothetical protein